MSKPTTALLLMLVLLGFGTEREAAAIGPELTISESESADYRPAIAYNSLHDEHLVVWEEIAADGSHDVFARRVTAGGVLLDRFAVATGGNDQLEPAVAYDPVNDRYLVTWTYDYWGDGSDWDIFGRFVPWYGPTAGLADFGICTWPSGQAHSSVAYGGANQELLVAWISFPAGEPSYVSARRVYADGSGFPLGDGFTVWSGAQPADFPDVAYNGARAEYLVAWDVVLSAHNIDIHAQRVSSSGVLLGADLVVAGWDDAEERPAVAASAAADQYLVAWQSDQGTIGVDLAIYARYLAGDGTLGTIHLIDDTICQERNVDVATNRAGTHYFLAWQTAYSSGIYGIWGRAAYPNDELADSHIVVQPSLNRNREHPAVGGGERLFLVAWEHQRTSDGNRDLHGRLVHDDIFLDGYESGDCYAWDDEVP
jgi:hypothetical protein